jgi:hypothetical protein
MVTTLAIIGRGKLTVQKTGSKREITPSACPRRADASQCAICNSSLIESA